MKYIKFSILIKMNHSVYSLWIGIILILHLIKNGEAFEPIPPGTVYSWRTPPPWGESLGYCSKYEIKKYAGAMPEELCTIFRKWEKGGADRTEVEQRYGNIEYWNTSNVVSMSGIFSNSIINFDINQWDTSKVINMEWMFYYADFADASYQDLSDWDTSKVTTMKKMFEMSDFNGDISDWDVSQVADMQYMFYGNRDFYQDLSKWDVSHVWYISNMFYGADLMEENRVTLCDGLFGTRMSQAKSSGTYTLYPRSGCCPAGSYMFNPQATLNNAFDPNSGCTPCPPPTVPTTKENAFLSCRRVHFIIGDQSKVTSDIPDGLYGDISGVTGDIPTTVYGNISGIIGQIPANVHGDLGGILGVIPSGMSGDLSGITGTPERASGHVRRGTILHIETCANCVNKSDARALREAYNILPNTCPYHN